MRPFGHRVLNAAQGLLSTTCHNVPLCPITRSRLQTKSISTIITTPRYSVRNTRQLQNSPILSRCYSTPTNDGKDKKPEDSPAPEPTTSSTAESTLKSETTTEAPPIPPKSDKRAPIYDKHHPLSEIFKNLPSQLEQRRSKLSKRFSKAMDELHVAAFTAGRRLNDVTGYSEIEALKRSIEEQERNVILSRERVKAAKDAYALAIANRSASQREVNELLQRKHAWSPSDLERFTSLYRNDHANEQAESKAADELAMSEREADAAQATLAKSILARYHEEQIWSDKIRRASTWGTWGLMGFNVLLFIVVQLGLEPWKRRRLVGGFEEKVREVIQEESLRNALLVQTREDAATATVSTAATAAVVAATPDAPDATSAPALATEVVDEQPPSYAEATAQTEDVSEFHIQDLIPEWKHDEDMTFWQQLVNFWEVLFSEDVVYITRSDLARVALSSMAVGSMLSTILGMLAMVMHYST
ncbi:hypothetical protein BJ508DRAFT_409977 [Ascobolus immersus RN42]|uniref:Sensitive to high expression protein 9, mitochondrial n=1 Tax=Ascobolus immersus RN42 TaxID=1160509 RepID=A0A3N4IPG8_ASCIM|nr:hypothetical protein BJ508DRAFT_409977 [Ascobolus immersus RN42]